jgi:hypothetical protein
MEMSDYKQDAVYDESILAEGDVAPLFVPSYIDGRSTHDREGKQHPGVPD